MTAAQRSAWLPFTALLTTAAVAPLANAADTTRDLQVLQEVIVTAQKRQEVLIDVPQSVTVVDGASLERLQATSFEDYLKLVPGLQLTQDTPGVGRLVLRGVNTQGVASTVAVYVDETPFGSSTGLVNGAILAGDFDTYDMQRIEVLRGPQGTLYGASSLGGILKFVTNRPQLDKTEARFRTNVESVEGGDMGYGGSAVVNVAASDTVAFRATGYYHDEGGFIDSIGTAGSDVQKDINGSTSYGGRVSALFQPSDKFSLRLTASLQNIRSDAPSTVESDPDTLDELYGGLTLSQYVPQVNHVKYRVYNANMDIDLGFATLTSATSYGKLDEPFRSDLTPQFSAALEPLIGPNETLLQQVTKYDKTTEELRLASPSSDQFEWLVGGYYTHEEGDIIQHIGAVQPGTLTPIPGLPSLADATLNSKYDEYAAFLSGTIHFGDRFDLTAGGRYSKNEQEATQDLSGLLVGSASFPKAKSDEDVVTYSVAPKLKFGDHASLYARVASGFRPGGPNVLPPGAPANVPRTYDSDSIVSYEIGYKAESASRTVMLDVAAFHIDWRDIQLFALVNSTGVNVNGGDAASDGFEFTLTGRPTEDLRLSLNGAYTDTELKDNTDPVVGGFKGDELPYTPKLSVNASADYQWPVGAATAYAGGSIRYLSDQTADYDFAFRTTNGKQREIDSYSVVDLQGGVDFGRYSIELYAKNVGNSDGRTSAAGVGTFPNGAIGTGVIRPRTIGLAFSAQF